MIRFNDIEAAQRVARAIPRNYNPATDTSITHHDADGKLLGGVIYDGYTRNCIFIHQAGFSKMWLTGDMLKLAFDYPFNQLGVAKLAGTIPSSKPELLEFNQRLGFKEECRIKDAYPDGDMLVLTMTREQCRWLKFKPRTMRSNHER